MKMSKAVSKQSTEAQTECKKNMLLYGVVE